MCPLANSMSEECSCRVWTLARREPDSKRDEQHPPGQFVSDEHEADCSRFLAEVKESIRRRSEARPRPRALRRAQDSAASKGTSAALPTTTDATTRSFVESRYELYSKWEIT